MLGAIATAAFVVGGLAAAFSGYNSLKTVADVVPIEHYHGAPAVEAVASKAEVKESRVKTSAVSAEIKLPTQHSIFPPPAVVKKTPQKEVSKTADELYDEWSRFYEQHGNHVVQKNDTIVDLWRNNYQGPLAFDEYLREVKRQNPQLKNPDKIWPGQMLIIPSVAGKDNGNTRR